MAIVCLSLVPVSSNLDHSELKALFSVLWNLDCDVLEASLHVFELEKDMSGLRFAILVSEPNFLICRFLLLLAERYNFKAKVLIKGLSIGISMSKCSCPVRVYQSYPPMIRRALFWTTCRQDIYFEMKAQAEKAQVIMGPIQDL